MNPLSPNTQAILLLTGPLIAGGSEAQGKILSLSEYNKLAKRLGELQQEPADLLLPGADALLRECGPVIAVSRLQALLDRGFLLAQVVERWQARSIWVVSRADPAYPRRLKDRLKKDAPAIIYGCGSGALLDAGGLAVVGPRDADKNPELMSYTMAVGAMAARSEVTIVSGGARGVDQTAMSGALDAGGKATGILVADLERAALKRENRQILMNERLVLISPFDPGIKFLRWNAMGRNKLIYALSDAALVVDADPVKGGTRDGALEQLDKLRFVPVYVRASGTASAGLDALRDRGALLWPEPRTPDELADVFAAAEMPTAPSRELPLFQSSAEPPLTPLPEATLQAEEKRQDPADMAKVPASDTAAPEAPVPQSPADILFATVRELLMSLLTKVMKDAEVAQALDVSKAQASEWLKRLLEEGAIVKSRKPSGYLAAASQSRLI